MAEDRGKGASCARLQTKEKRVSKCSTKDWSGTKTGVRAKHTSPSPYLLRGIVQINNASNIHLGHQTIYEAAHQPRLAHPKDRELKPSIKLALMVNDEEVNTKHREAVASQVGSDWRFLGRELAGFSNGQMDQLEEPFLAKLQPFHEVIYQMLLKWEDHMEKKPTVGRLAHALDKCNMHSALRALSEATSPTSTVTDSDPIIPTIPPQS